MKGRQRTTPPSKLQTRRLKHQAKDAQSGAKKPAGRQKPETADEAQQEADVARNDTNIEQTHQTESKTPADVPQSKLKDATNVGTAAETTGAEVKATADEANMSPDAANSATETPAMLALRKWREHPTCCCGCGQTLSSPKKHFVQGHDGRAKKIIRAIMHGELEPKDAPTELILRHAEIKFIMLHPEFRRVVEVWREMCGLARSHATN